MAAALFHGGSLVALSTTILVAWAGERGDRRTAVASGCAAWVLCVGVAVAMSCTLLPPPVWVP